MRLSQWLRATAMVAAALVIAGCNASPSDETSTGVDSVSSANTGPL